MAPAHHPTDAAPRRGRLARALLQLGVLALVLAAGVAVVQRRAAARRELAAELQRARAAAARGNQGDLHQALEVVEGALAREPGAGAAAALAAALWTDLWLLHREPGAEARARAALARAEALDARVDERFAAKTLVRLEAGDARGAVELAEARRREGFSGPRLLAALGKALQAQGDLALARVALARAADGARHDGNLPAALGEALLEQGQPGAGDAFRTALDLSPTLWRARLGLALARARAGQRLDEAAASLADARAHAAELSAPQRARLIAVEAGLALARGDAAGAAAAAQRAVDQEPLDRWARFFLGAARAGLGDGPGAASAFAELGRVALDAPALVLEGAQLLQRSGQGEAAAALLDRYRDFYLARPAVAADGGRATALDRDDLYWLCRGELLVAFGHEDEALAALDAAVAARASHLPAALVAKAGLLARRRDAAGAEALLRPLTPDDGSGPTPEAYLALGALRFAARDFGPGSQSYALGLALLQQARAPAARRQALFEDVRRQLEAAGQPELVRLWLEEARPLAR